MDFVINKLDERTFLSIGESAMIELSNFRVTSSEKNKINSELVLKVILQNNDTLTINELTH